ncbi:MAG: type II toxin-antitoxin system RelE/ParE family toxin [Moraxella sp.]|nr:type II toxin-antitoxin system RelE/ParE family toxin [Moraxella sp.]
MNELREPCRSIYDVVYEPLAQSDLNKIAEYYTKTADFDVASVILERIATATDTLTTMPERCKVIDLPNNAQIRRLLVPKTPIIVYFEIIASTVHVLKIEHGKADQSHLADLLVFRPYQKEL